MKKYLIEIIVVLCLLGGCEKRNIVPERITISKYFSSTRYYIPEEDIPTVIELLETGKELSDQAEYKPTPLSLLISYRINEDNINCVISKDGSGAYYDGEKIQYFEYDKSVYENLLNYIR